MKKVLLSIMMVSLMVVTVFPPVFSANAISIKNEETRNEETTGMHTITAWVIDWNLYPVWNCGIPNAIVVLKSTDGNISRVKRTDIMGYCYFYNIPDKYNSLNLLIEKVYALRFKILEIWWSGGAKVWIKMYIPHEKQKIINTPFLDNFPLLTQNNRDILPLEFRS